MALSEVIGPSARPWLGQHRHALLHHARQAGGPHTGLLCCPTRTQPGFQQCTGSLRSNRIHQRHHHLQHVANHAVTSSAKHCDFASSEFNAFDQQLFVQQITTGIPPTATAARLRTQTSVTAAAAATSATTLLSQLAAAAALLLPGVGCTASMPAVLSRKAYSNAVSFSLSNLQQQAASSCSLALVRDGSGVVRDGSARQ